MRTNVATTSIEAFHAHEGSGKASTQRGRILDYMQDSLLRDWSIGELAHALRMEKSTISARLNELLKAGEVRAAAERADRISGIRVRPVRLASAQQEMFS